MGINGIAPDAKVNVYKACWYADKGDKALCSSWTLAKAVDAAINSGNRIINLSLSGPEDPLLKKLLVTANGRHIAVVAAALEASKEPGFPASLPFVIPVVSSDPKGEIKVPPWQAKQATVAAPGVEVLTTLPGDRYDFLSGSSLAAASVSGVVALMLQARSSLSPDAIKTGLLASASQKPDYNHANETNKPVLVDACRAIQSIGLGVACPE